MKIYIVETSELRVFETGIAAELSGSVFTNRERAEQAAAEYTESFPDDNAWAAELEVIE